MEFLGPGTEGMSPQAGAGILVERLKNAGDLGDRRDALDALLKLSETHPTDVGHAGMPTFTDILQAGIADAGMTQTIMGIMLNLVEEREGPGTGASVSSFLKDVQNVQNLLDLLESQDSLTAMSAVQVLQALQKASPDSLEDCILECPAGLQALVEVLRDPREEVRNEVILLLGQLTSSNLEVKKFVAFQEGFERLFDIMAGEGMLEGGGVIVKDCLDVCLNLLTGSSLTKSLFCQSNCLKRFHDLIDVRAAGGGGDAAVQPDDTAEGDNEARITAGGELSSAQATRMSPMQSEIASKALDLLMLLLTIDTADSPQEGDGKKVERQSVVAATQEGMLSEMLAHVGFSRAEAFSHAPLPCREKAMRVTGAVVDGHPTNQYNMGELLVQDVGLDSVALATLVMEGALGAGGADPALNETFHWVMGCFFHGNELVCTQVVSHVIAPPPPPLELEDLEAWVPPTPTGKVLLDSLVSSAKVLFGGSEVGELYGGDDGEGRWGSAVVRAADVMSRGCMILSMLFTHGGGLTKEIALRVPIAPSPDTHTTTLLHALLRWLELATSHPHNPATTGPSDDHDPGFSNGGMPSTGGKQNTNAGVSNSHSDVAARAIADAGVSLLRLLCRWVHNCTAAVREMLGNPSNLFVIDVAAGRCSLVSGGGGDAGEGGTARGVTAAQCAGVKGLACLMLGLMLEYVEGAGSPSSGGDGNDGSSEEWTRDLVMKMIQNRVGMTPFMASIEATKRAFGDADAAQRRRQRAARDRKGSDGGDQAFCASNGGLRLDPNFRPLLEKASEEVRRRVISIFTHGGGYVAGGDAAKASPDPGKGVTGASDAASEAGLASVVEVQEREICSLKKEIFEAVSRLPRDGGVTALEESLGDQVKELEETVSANSKEIGKLGAELSEALGQVSDEKQRGDLLTSELQGLSITMGSLERQLLDREAVCDGLRRELDAGGDRSERELELSRQVEEARARASSAEDALEQLQRQSMADAAADEAAVNEAAREATLEAEAKWSARVEELQAALEEARGDAKSAAGAVADADTAPHATASIELVKTVEDLADARRALLKAAEKVEELERALAKNVDEAEASKRERALLRDAAEAARLSLEEEREKALASEARRTEEAERAAAGAEALRQQLDSAVRNLAEASFGGDEQVGALQKELSAVREREERQTTEWRRRMDESTRLAKEESARSELMLVQTEKRLNDHWTLQIQNMEVTAARLEEELRASKEAREATANTTAAQITALEGEKSRLEDQADRVEVLVARCAKLEEAAASAGVDAERRLREEMEQGRDMVRGAEGSVSEVERRLQEALSELSTKGIAMADLQTSLDEVKAYLRQSKADGRDAEEREASAASEVKGLRKAVKAAEDDLHRAAADLEDRDSVIAAVEDARAAQEREAERLRDKLRGMGMLSPPHAGANGNSGNDSLGGGFDDADEGGRDTLVDGEEYLELLSEHEDLLQLLAQQEVVRKKLLTALRECGGLAAARAVMEEAEAEVTDTYGGFVRFTDDQDLDEHEDGNGHLPEAGEGGGASGRRVAV